MIDFAARRLMMVDTQVRPQDVTKFPIIDAMLTVPREAFVPDDQQEAAYVGGHIELGHNRVLLEPRTFAKMLDALNPGPGELVLDIGAGLGYSSAVVARLAQAVIAVEDDAGRVAEASEALMDSGADNVVMHEGPLVDGATEHGPYDAVLIEGGVAEVPASILDQVKEGGRIAAIFMEGALGRVMIGHKADGTVVWRFAFNADAPVLPGFEAAIEFSL